MIEFKQIPVLRWYDKDEDDENKNPHYTLSFMWANVGEVIPNTEFNDGTNSSGNEDNDLTLENKIKEEEIVAAFKNRQPDWNAVKTIYFRSSCTVPRFKLGNFCKKHNISVTRSEAKADLILYGKGFAERMFSETNDEFITKKYFLERVKKLKGNRIPPEYIVKAIQHCSSELVSLCTKIEWFVPKKGRINGPYWTLDDQEKYNLLIQNNKFCSQDVILNDMNPDPMDESMFRRLCEMFESKDNSNHRLAMELMSNCNYRESIVYLLELMRRYYFSQMYMTNDRDHVSFKALREYLQYEPKGEVRSLNNIIENVAKRNLLTESNYRLILRLIIEEEGKRMGPYEGDEEEDADNWRVTDVDLSPKYKAKVIWDKKEEEAVVLEEKQPDFTA